MKRKGFTLIELLVVIAIIGILAAMVLVALGTTRNKAKDARIMGAISEYRTAAEAYASDNNGNYSTTGAGATDVCTLSGASDIYGLANLRTDIDTQNGSSAVSCATSTAPATAWAIWSPLASDATKAFCADSTGKTKSYAPADTKPAGTATSCS